MTIEGLRKKFRAETGDFYVSPMQIGYYIDWIEAKLILSFFECEKHKVAVERLIQLHTFTTDKCSACQNYTKEECPNCEDKLREWAYGEDEK